MRTILTPYMIPYHIPINYRFHGSNPKIHVPDTRYLYLSLAERHEHSENRIRLKVWNTLTENRFLLWQECKFDQCHRHTIACQSILQPSPKIRDVAMKVCRKRGLAHYTAMGDSKSEEYRMGFIHLLCLHVHYMDYLEWFLALDVYSCIFLLLLLFQIRKNTKKKKKTTNHFIHLSCLYVHHMNYLEWFLALDGVLVVNWLQSLIPGILRRLLPTLLEESNCKSWALFGT